MAATKSGVKNLNIKQYTPVFLKSCDIHRSINWVYHNSTNSSIKMPVENFGPFQSLEPLRSVYLLHYRNEEPEQNKRLVLKQLKIGAVKSFLIGELLWQGANCFDHEAAIKRRNNFDGGAPILPNLVKPAPANNYWWFRGNRYLLTHMLPGREADYKQLDDLQAAIRTMNILHRFSQSVIDGNPHRWSFLKMDLKKEWWKRIREMAACREIAIRTKTPWNKQYVSCWSKFHDQAWKALQELENLDRDPVTVTRVNTDVICYHDWAHHNLIIDEGKAYLVDFDDLIVDRPVHDRTNLIGRYLRLNRWSTESFFKIIWNFDRFYPWKEGELRWLRAFLTFPYDYWMLGRQYFIEKQPWSMKYYQDQWERKIACQIEREKVLKLIKLME
jgi:CotS family spore coat protein